MKVFTIGFTKTSAESFFTRLQKAGVKKVVDHCTRQKILSCNLSKTYEKSAISNITPLFLKGYEK